MFAVAGEVIPLRGIVLFHSQSDKDMYIYMYFICLQAHYAYIPCPENCLRLPAWKERDTPCNAYNVQ